jgi:hypothetical protein
MTHDKRLNRHSRASMHTWLRGTMCLVALTFLADAAMLPAADLPAGQNANQQAITTTQSTPGATRPAAGATTAGDQKPHKAKARPAGNRLTPRQRKIWKRGYKMGRKYLVRNILLGANILGVAALGIVVWRRRAVSKAQLVKG